MSDIYQYKAVIFDMDSLLLDSERLYINAYEITCLELNVKIDLSLMMSAYGTSKARTLEIFTKYFESSEFARKRFNLILENYNNLISEKPIELQPIAPIVQLQLSWLILESGKKPLGGFLSELGA